MSLRLVAVELHLISHLAMREQLYLHISTSPPYPAWIRDAAEHAEAIEEVLLAQYQLERGQLNGRLTRKTLALSKSLEMYRASTAWGEAVHDLVRPLEALRGEVFDDPNRHWKPRTPAMAAGLTDHIWTVEDLLTAVAPPINTSGFVNSDKSQTVHPP